MLVALLCVGRSLPRTAAPRTASNPTGEFAARDGDAQGE